MSIYSGFATRAQQQCYDQCIDSLLYVLQRRIIKFYKNEEADEEKFVSLILKMHHQLKNMEHSKYLEPKTSNTINQLAKFMNIHQKNEKIDKNKTPENGSNVPITHERRENSQQKDMEESAVKKKQSLWVPKKIFTVDQDMQTMGTILDKKDSPKDNSASRASNHRNVISSLRTKYGEKFPGPKQHRLRELPPAQNQNFNRSHSHHLGHNEIYNYDHEVRNHLKELEVSHKRKKKTKLSQKIGMRDLPTEQKSEYQVGDIIKDYVTRVKRKVEIPENQKSGKERMDDF